MKITVDASVLIVQFVNIAVKPISKPRMKNFTRAIPGLFIMIALLAFMPTRSAEGQTIPLKPCLEHFTSSSCAPCGAFAPVFRKMLAPYQGQYTIIRYQMYWPGDGDPYYFAESKKRRDYYEVTGVPGLIKDGIKQLPYAQSFSATIMDSLLALKTGMSMDITASIDDDKIVTATVTITPEIAYPAGLVAQIVVMEGVTTENATTNSERAFDHVTMGFLPNANGTALQALVPGEPVVLTYTLDMKTTHMETANDLIVASFVQNNDTKAVLQSENAPVSSSYADYQVTLHIIDNDYNTVPGGSAFIPLFGEVEFGPDGNANFQKVLPGTLTYEVSAPEYDEKQGELTLNDANVKTDVMIEKPDIYFYEDFGWNTIPQGWDTDLQEGFYLLGSGTREGTLVFYKPSDMGDDNYLIMPPLNMTQSGIFSFRAGNQSLNPQLSVGIVTLGSNPGVDGTHSMTVTSFDELYSTTVTKGDGFSILSFPLPETIGNQRLAFKYTGVTSSFCELDQVAVLEMNPGVRVQFLVYDQNDEPLKNTTVTFNGKSLTSNDYGYSTFRDTDPGSYPYTVTYKDEEIASGNLQVDGEMVKEIHWNTSGISEQTTGIPIAIYPNPVRDHFIISGITRAKVTMTTLSGQQLIKKEIVDGERIGTADLDAGLYLLKVETGDRTFYQKILISK
jgi:hypothetical protein